MAVVVGAVSHPKLNGFKLRQFYCSGVADASTFTSGIQNIQEVAVRTGAGSTSTAPSVQASGVDAPTLTAYYGTLASSRRVAAHITNVATGEITFYAPFTGTCILQIWSRD